MMMLQGCQIGLFLAEFLDSGVFKPLAGEIYGWLFLCVEWLFLPFSRKVENLKQIKTLITNMQWRRQGLMVGEAHLVGEANIFNVKYIIHECGLPTIICRPPPGR